MNWKKNDIQLRLRAAFLFDIHFSFDHIFRLCWNTWCSLILHLKLQRTVFFLSKDFEADCGCVLWFNFSVDFFKFAKIGLNAGETWSWLLHFRHFEKIMYNLYKTIIRIASCDLSIFFFWIAPFLPFHRYRTTFQFRPTYINYIVR